MTFGGWTVMLLSVGGATFFFVWCIWRVLRPPGSTHKMHGVLDTEAEIEEKERRKK